MATILLVDDNLELLHIYGELLTEAGHRVEPSPEDTGEPREGHPVISDEPVRGCPMNMT